VCELRCECGCSVGLLHDLDINGETIELTWSDINYIRWRERSARPRNRRHPGARRRTCLGQHSPFFISISSKAKGQGLRSLWGRFTALHLSITCNQGTRKTLQYARSLRHQKSFTLSPVGQEWPAMLVAVEAASRACSAESRYTVTIFGAISTIELIRHLHCDEKVPVCTRCASRGQNAYETEGKGTGIDEGKASRQK
jgi:hypothetical protein